MVAQVFNLCKRRLKPAASKNHLMIATRYEMTSIRLWEKALFVILSEAKDLVCLRFISRGVPSK